MRRLLAILGSAALLSGCSGGTPAGEAGASLTPVARQVTGETSGTPTPEAVPTPLFRQEFLGELPSGVTTTADQRERPGQALAFSGEGSKVSVPLDINAAKFPLLTVTAWVRFRGDVASTPQMQAFSQDNGDFDRGFGVDHRAGRWGWSAFGGTAGVFGGAPVKAEEWTFLVLIYDQLNQQASLLVNDETFEVAKADLGAGESFFWLGGNPGFDEFFVGDIAHLQIFDRLLTPEQLVAVKDR